MPYYSQLLIVFLFLFVSIPIRANLLPIPLKAQLKESSAVVRGKYIGQIYKKMHNGTVVTEYTFDISHHVGLEKQFLRNPRQFKFMTPGGFWGGISYKVLGSPVFLEDRDFILLLKKNSDGFWLSNLSLGKYDLMYRLNKETLISSVFPDNENLSGIDIALFEAMVKEIFGTALIKIEHGKIVIAKSVQQDVNDDFSNARKPASLGEVSEDKEDITSLWPFLLLFLVMTFIFAIKIRNV